MPEETKESASFYAKTRMQWRRWLEKNHQSKDFVWLIIHHKKSKAPGLNYVEAVEEALCFGWIDSKAVKRDADSHYQYFARRKPRSNWSKSNRERVARMTGQGLMMPAGLAQVDLAKKTGTWEAMVDVENAVIPDDLRKLFAKNKKALKNFEAFSPSSRKMILQWILMAKKPETRLKRIGETVSLAEKNLKSH